MFKILLYYNTIKYLKFSQIYYRIYYFFKKKLFSDISFNPNYTHKENVDLKLNPILRVNNQYVNGTFTFINLSKQFSDICWNFNEYGNLWAYNLNYFDFLNQKEISFEDCEYLIKDFIKKYNQNTIGKEPYPSSLRGINWIKFVVINKNRIDNKFQAEINSCLYAQMRHLNNNIEYHLSGNHLLENSFSLLFAAYYFKNTKFYKKAKTILIKELKEQILNDGGHFELSPMYHQIILFRMLDCFNLVKNNDLFANDLQDVFNVNICKMMSWLINISFSNNVFPLFNDSAFNIAPDFSKISNYSDTLGIISSDVNNLRLDKSGYRIFSSIYYKLIVDIGNIGPEYITGHAHSDTFNFELYVHDFPVIIDTGTSTYSDHKRRMIERSTSSHNTVMAGDYEQSEIWAFHRVAKRAYAKVIKEDENSIIASHNGYKNLGISHQRSFLTYPDKIEISDKLTGLNNIKSFAFFHFHPSVELKIEDNYIFGKDFNIHLMGEIEDIQISNYKFAPEFNILIDSKVIKVRFTNNLNTIIRF
jgi:uncharacterized heparinase superfamily protein